MKVSYSRFFDKLKANGYTQKVFKEERGISGGTMGKLIKNQNIKYMVLQILFALILMI